MCDTFMMILLPTLPAVFGARLLMKYLQTQGIVHPIVLAGFLTNVAALGLNFLIVKYLKQGFMGVAMVLVIGYYIQVVLLLLYIVLKKVYKKTWMGWSIECLYDWKEFIALAFPGMLMVCMEWWTFEVGTFLMGKLSISPKLAVTDFKFGEDALAAHGVLLQVVGLTFMFPLGISIAASVLVGNYLGANNPSNAKLVTKLSIALTILCASIVVVFGINAKYYIAMAFSDNKNVIDLIVETIPLICLFTVLDGIQGVCSGIIRGCGQQKIGMVINFISHDVVAIPLAIILAFVVDLRLAGIN
ncbi:hypothetical protein QZH41_018960 [Actinostola sp. cb2023]|nr:hypothetical protein QZH41_018960 [Actinostola sp. cb2023]